MSAWEIEIAPSEVAELLRRQARVILIDVREPWELELACLEGVENIPMMQVPLHFERLREAAPEQIVILCHTGQRSLLAADWMRRSGLPQARSMAGGIDRWSREVDPRIPRY